MSTPEGPQGERGATWAGRLALARTGPSEQRTQPATPMRRRVRDNLVGLGGVVERNVYLTRRYIWWDLAFFVWTIANTLTIVFIADGVQATGGSIDVARATTFLLIGAVIWAYLGIIFEFMTETVAWERWEGTIEYTFMAPLGRFTHLAGMGAYSVLYGLIRAVGLFLVVGLFFDLSMPDADFLTALVVLLVASVSFIGIGMMTAVLPLISPEKGAQLGFVAQGVLLVVSGVYYPVDVLPGWMEKISAISPATYALDGVRRAILDGDGLSTMGPRPAQARGDRRGLHPGRAGAVLRRRAVRQAQRQAQAVRLRRAETRDGPGSPGPVGTPQTLKPSARSCSRPSSVILSGPHGGIQTQLILKSAATPPPGPPSAPPGSGPRSRRSAGRPPRSASCPG